MQSDSASNLSIVRYIVEGLSILTNFSIILLGIKLIRHVTEIEFKVNMMWGVFQRRFGTRTERAKNIEDED